MARHMRHNGCYANEALVLLVTFKAKANQIGEGCMDLTVFSN